MTKIVIIRMRGEVNTRRDVIDTFKMLGLKRSYSVTVLENTPSNIGMIRKIDNFAAWGEATEETEKLISGICVRRGASLVGGLKPPKGGFKSKKLHYPRGVLGYNGGKINDLVKKMI